MWHHPPVELPSRLVALLYLVAWLLATRVRWLSDVELRRDGASATWPAVEAEASAG